MNDQRIEGEFHYALRRPAGVSHYFEVFRKEDDHFCGAVFASFNDRDEMTASAEDAARARIKSRDNGARHFIALEQAKSAERVANEKHKARKLVLDLFFEVGKVCCEDCLAEVNKYIESLNLPSDEGTPSAEAVAAMDEVLADREAKDQP